MVVFNLKYNQRIGNWDSLKVLHISGDFSYSFLGFQLDVGKIGKEIVAFIEQKFIRSEGFVRFLKALDLQYTRTLLKVVRFYRKFTIIRSQGLIVILSLAVQQRNAQ